MIERELDFCVGGTGQGNRGIPVDAVMANEEIRSGINRGLKRGVAPIDARGNFFDGAIIFNLEPVVGTFEIADFGAPGSGITESDDFLEGGHNLKSEDGGADCEVFFGFKILQGAG